MEKLIQKKIPLKQSIYLLALTCILQTSCFEQEAVEKGDSITFGCPLKEEVTQRWRYNGQVIVDSQSATPKSTNIKLTMGSTNEWFNMTLTTAKMADRGTYDCQESKEQNWVTQTAYNLTVLEAPVCGNSTSLSLDSGDILRVFCVSDISGVTLIWHVGVHGERSVGAKADEDSSVYETSVDLIASPSMNGKFVYCELQHPSWHVLDGIIDCKIGPVSIRSSTFQISCDLLSDSPTGSSASVSCSISSSEPQLQHLQQLSAETLVWQGDFGGEGFETLDLQQELQQTTDGGWSTTVVLDQKLRQSLNAIRLQAGDVVGDAIVLGPFRSTTSYGAVVIVMVVLILIAVVVFFVVVILYRQGRIFKPPQNHEIEMDKRALTQPSPLEKAKEENRLLTHGVDAQRMPSTEDLEEGVDAVEAMEA